MLVGHECLELESQFYEWGMIVLLYGLCTSTKVAKRESFATIVDIIA